MDTFVAGVDTKSSTGLIRPTKWSSEQGNGVPLFHNAERMEEVGERSICFFREGALLCKDERINKDPNQSTCMIHLRTVIWLYKLYNYISYILICHFFDSSDSKSKSSDFSAVFFDIFGPGGNPWDCHGPRDLCRIVPPKAYGRVPLGSLKNSRAIEQWPFCLGTFGWFLLEKKGDDWNKLPRNYFRYLFHKPF